MPPAGALLGFLNKVVSLHTDYPEHNLLVAFDAGPTFRNDLLSTYKGSRKKMPPDLRTQLAAIYEACDALGVPYFTRGELEGPQEIFVEAPGGIIIDIAHSGRAKTPLGLAPWHLCMG